MMPGAAISCRTLFLSDFHIGAKTFDADALVDFLRHHECETLYLVGDIIDGWKLQKRWHWSESVSAVIDELVRKAYHGTKIIYITGNHDEEVRFLPLYRRLRFARRMGIQIKNKVLHETRNGKKMLVLHGDQFDRKIFNGPLARVSDDFYDKFLDMIGAHARHMRVRVNGKIKPFSLAKFLGTQGQRALNLLNDFERAVMRLAIEEKIDGIICGHTHIPALKTLNGVLYANCGSWLRSGHTALAEDHDGTLRLIDWPKGKPLMQATFDFFAPEKVQQPEAIIFRPVTEQIIRSIQRTFSPAVANQSLIEQARVRVSELIALHKLRLHAYKGDGGVRDEIGWHRF